MHQLIQACINLKKNKTYITSIKIFCNCESHKIFDESGHAQCPSLVYA